jgi:hypothetical protein
MISNCRTIPLDSPDLVISVDQIRPSPKGGKTLAYADVRIGPVCIFGVSVVENKDGKGHFVGFPFVRGATRKFPIVEIPDESIRTQVCVLVLDAWKGMARQ